MYASLRAADEKMRQEHTIRLALQQIETLPVPSVIALELLGNLESTKSDMSEVEVRDQQLFLPKLVPLCEKYVSDDLD